MYNRATIQRQTHQRCHHSGRRCDPVQLALHDLCQDVHQLLVLSLGGGGSHVLPQPGRYHPQMVQGHESHALLGATVTEGLYLGVDIISDKWNQI